jgi:hypothetical protein
VEIVNENAADPLMKDLMQVDKWNESGNLDLKLREAFALPPSC